MDFFVIRDIKFRHTDTKQDSRSCISSRSKLSRNVDDREQLGCPRLDFTQRNPGYLEWLKALC